MAGVINVPPTTWASLMVEVTLLWMMVGVIAPDLVIMLTHYLVYLSARAHVLAIKANWLTYVIVIPCSPMVSCC